MQSTDKRGLQWKQRSLGSGERELVGLESRTRYLWLCKTAHTHTPPITVQTMTTQYLTLLLLIKRPRMAQLVALLWVTQPVTTNS